MADWITTAEASEMTGYNVEYLRDLIRKELINAQKKGGQFWVEHCSLLEYLQQANKEKDKRHGPRKKKN